LARVLEGIRKAQGSAPELIFYLQSYALGTIVN